MDSDFNKEKVQWILDKKLTLNREGYEVKNLDEYIDSNTII